MKKFLTLLFLTALPLGATTHTAATASRADVGTALALCVDGDTLAIPAGTASWTTTLNVSAAIIIQGAGIGVTTIQEDAVGTGITTSSAINLATVAGKTYRVTGISFVTGVVRTAAFTKGCIRVAGTGTQTRIDHCRFSTSKNRAITTVDATTGLVDHCEIAPLGTQAVHVGSQTYAGGTMGNGRYAAAHTMGTADCWIFEDNIYADPTGAVCGVIDSEDGGAWCLRHNSITRGIVTCHGPENASGGGRGTRQFEIYANTILGGNQYANAIHIRSGAGVIFGNTVTDYKNFCTLNWYRSSHNNYTYWGIADGRNAWDQNLAGGPFATGTCTSATIGSVNTMTDSGKSWTVNQWAGYHLHNLTTGRSAPIMSNNATTITEWPAASQNPTQGGGLLMPFATGNTYEFWKITNAMDAPGMGQSSVPVPTSFPSQTIEGIYSWDNTLDGVAANPTSPKYPFIVAGTHYFLNTAKPGYTPYTYPHPLIGGAAPSVPAAPSAPMITAVSYSRIDVSWTDNSADEQGFRVFRSPTTATGFEQIATTTAAQFVDLELPPSTQRFYKVCSYNEAGDSALTSEVNATTFAPPGAGKGAGARSLLLK